MCGKNILPVFPVMFKMVVWRKILLAGQKGVKLEPKGGSLTKWPVVGFLLPVACANL